MDLTSAQSTDQSTDVSNLTSDDVTGTDFTSVNTMNVSENSTDISQSTTSLN